MIVVESLQLSSLAYPKLMRSLSRCVLTSDGVSHVMLRGNQVQGSILWTLGIPKMYMGALGYKVLISHLKYRVV